MILKEQPNIVDMKVKLFGEKKNLFTVLGKFITLKLISDFSEGLRMFKVIFAQ